jgi:hypothetical protein
MTLTLSTTAYLGIVLVFVAVFFGFGLAQLLSGGSISKTLFGMLCMTLILTWFVLIITTASSEVRDLLSAVLTEKDGGDSFRFRLEADMQSLAIVWHTYGFGLGLGGNRPSSFITLLLSNLGLFGLFGFLMFMASLSKVALTKVRKIGNARLVVLSIAAVWALWATMGAKVLAQPDLSFAPLWVWAFFLASLCVCTQRNSSPSSSVKTR